MGRGTAPVVFPRDVPLPVGGARGLEGVLQVTGLSTPGTFDAPVVLMHSEVVVDGPSVVIGPTAPIVEGGVARAFVSDGSDRTGV